MSITKTALKLVLGKGVFKSYSQFGEDAILNAVFRNKITGRYVDIGSYHPILYSNTYALYKRGWSGTCVDPNDFSRLYKVFRPRDTFINSAVGEGGAIIYYYHQDGAHNGFQKSSNSPVVGTKEITLRPLREFITTPVDFLSIDCEGMDLRILKSHDWKIKPTVIAIETEAEDFLSEKGYRLIGMTGATKIYSL
jgi:hypothetical protein